MEIVNDGNLPLADSLFTPNFLVYSSGRPSAIRGPNGLKQFVTTFRSAFPDLLLVIEDQIAEADRVVTRYSIRGTHRGSLQGIAPTQKEVRWSGITIHRISEGRIVESWVQLDQLGLFQQLGAYPTP